MDGFKMIDAALFDKLKWLPGKSGKEGKELWLPVWMHARDTAGIMDQLVEKWLPSHIYDSLLKDCTEDTSFSGICTFIALVHDLGKMTPAFADLISSNIPGCRERLTQIGLEPHTEKFRNSYIHSHGSAAILLQYDCPIGVAVIAASHHGLPPMTNQWNELSEIYKRNCQGKEESISLWKEIHAAWIADALERSGFAAMSDLPNLSKTAQVLLTGLLVMADWIASNPAYCPLIPLDENRGENIYPQRTLTAYEKVELTGPWNSNCWVMDEENFSRSFAYINPEKKITPNEIQSALLDAVEGEDDNGGIFILEAPMGSGKTEAALAAAERLNTQCGCGGLFFGLPTMVTANGIFERLKPWAEGTSKGDETANSIRLAHSMAELNDSYHELLKNRGSEEQAEINDEDDENSLVVTSWFCGRKQALLANFVVGTVDQLLMSTLARRHFMLRHLGLAGKVVILDEVHAYDAHMNCYLDRALQWLGKYKTPVIILSATLPAARRTALVKAYLNQPQENEKSDWQVSQAYPLLTWTNGAEAEIQQKMIPLQEQPRTVTIERLEDNTWLPWLKEKLNQGGCAGIVVNTVKRAQQLFAEVSAAFSAAEGFQAQLFHSRFLAPARAEREAELVRRIGKHSTPQTRDKLIIIGTQVLEQSLDIDFDVLLTDLCPMDLLLQRIGRLQRHQRLRPQPLQTAFCGVLGLDGEILKNSGKIYYDYLLLRTRELLPDKITLPTDISPLVQQTYMENIVEDRLSEEMRNQFEAYRTQIEILKEQGNAYCIGEPKAVRLQKFNTMVRIISHDNKGNEYQAEASVRDGTPSIEVLLIGSDTEGNAQLLSGKRKGVAVSVSDIPSSEIGREIAQQRIRLPYSFVIGDNINHTIAALEEQNKILLSAWQQSPWLKGSLILLLNPQYKVTLCGRTLEYTPEFGLVEIGKE